MQPGALSPTGRNEHAYASIRASGSGKGVARNVIHSKWAPAPLTVLKSLCPLSEREMLT